MASAPARRKNTKNQYIEDVDFRLLLTTHKALVEIPCGTKTIIVELKRSDWDLLVGSAEAVTAGQPRSSLLP